MAEHRSFVEGRSSGSIHTGPLEPLCRGQQQEGICLPGKRCVQLMRARGAFSTVTHGKTPCSKTANKLRRLSTSLENAHGTQPTTRKLLLGTCVFARPGCFVAQQLNVKLPSRAEERVAAGNSGMPDEIFSCSTRTGSWQVPRCEFGHFKLSSNQCGCKKSVAAFGVELI